MNRPFLYIDILAFGAMVSEKSPKIDNIFKIFDRLKVFNHSYLQTIVFSDTILVFPKVEEISTRPNHYFVTYLIEYAQQLFYGLSQINVYFKGIITYGDFHFKQMNNFQAYHGEALVETYNDESLLEGFGLYIKRELNNDVVVFKTVPFSEKYDYILLCQSLVNLSRDNEKLPVDLNIFSKTDTYHRIEEDLRFFRELLYIKVNHPSERIRAKYQKVYDIYKTSIGPIFTQLENDEFVPFTLNEYFSPSINHIEILAEKELGEN